MTGYGGHVLFLLVQSISPPLCTHSMNILNLIVCRTFLSKLEQGQKECDRCVYAQFMLRDNMGVVKRGDFIHEITLAHKNATELCHLCGVLVLVYGGKIQEISKNNIH